MNRVNKPAGSAILRRYAVFRPSGLAAGKAITGSPARAAGGDRLFHCLFDGLHIEAGTVLHWRKLD
jgi:hypothetical protein